MSRSRPDAGLWYYHAPEKNQAGMPKVNYPPPSQIPGLNGVAIDPNQAAEEEREKNGKFWFKETDTPYIRLAKLGGRKDLLVIPEKKPANAPPQSADTPTRYANRNARCDWFYQLDNLAEDAARSANEPKVEHKFQVPEYMVHHERKPRAPQGYMGAGNAPFATYGQMVSDSIDGGHPNDKTRKIQEPLRAGFGRRLAKQKEQDSKSQRSYYPPEFDEAPQRGMRSAPQQSAPPRYEYSMPPQHQPEPDNSNMTKLLSYGYQRDWVDEQNKWWNENERRAIRFAEDTGMDPNLPPRTIMAGNPSSGPGVSGSEYNQQYAHHSGQQPQQPTRRFEAMANADRMTHSRAPYGNDNN